MTSSVGSRASRRGRRGVWLRLRLVAAWPLLRVALQTGVGLAMLTQHEAIVLTLTGVATLLEIVQDRYTAHSQNCPCHDNGRINRCRPATADGDPSPDRKLGTLDSCAECREVPTMSEARS